MGPEIAWLTFVDFLTGRGLRDVAKVAMYTLMYHMLVFVAVVLTALRSVGGQAAADSAIKITLISYIASLPAVIAIQVSEEKRRLFFSSVWYLIAGVISGVISLIRLSVMKTAPEYFNWSLVTQSLVPALVVWGIIYLLNIIPTD